MSIVPEKKQVGMNPEFENYDKKAEKTAQEQKEKKLQIEEEFGNSKEGKLLKQGLGKENQQIFERIKTYYGNTENIIVSVKNAIEKDGTTMGLSFENKESQDKVINDLLSTYLGQSFDINTYTPDSDADLLMDTSLPNPSENPAFPLLKRFMDNGDMKEETLISIGDDIERGEALPNIMNHLSKDNDKGIEKVKNTVLNLDNPDKIQENKKNFLKDFEGFAPKASPQESNSSKNQENNKKSGIDLETDNIANLIAENYTPFLDKDGKTNKDADFSTAVAVASNKIISTTAALDKTTQSYSQAMQKIYSGDHTLEYKGLESLYIQAQAEKGKGTQEKQLQENVTTKTITDKKLDQKFNSIKELLNAARKNGNKKIIEQQQKKAEALKAEAQEEKPSSGEGGMGGGKQDVISQIDNLLEDKA